MLKPNETFKMQISTQMYNHDLRKSVVINKQYILRKMGLKFQNLEFNLSCKIIALYSLL